jgi:hypothetical protein
MCAGRERLRILFVLTGSGRGCARNVRISYREKRERWGYANVQGKDWEGVCPCRG